MSRRLLLALAAGSALTLPGCGNVLLSAETLSAADVADAAEDALEQEVGSRPDITCPEPLAKEEGASTRCTLTAADDPEVYGVTVSVTSTDGSTRIGVEVDDEPLGDPAG